MKSSNENNNPKIVVRFYVEIAIGVLSRHRHVLGSIVVSISACHVEDPGSIPGRGDFFFLSPQLLKS